jgi:hypothetical protein
MVPLFSRRTFLAASAIGLAAPVLGADRPKKLVILAGSPSHGPLEHEFNAGAKLLRSCLAQTSGLEISFHPNGWPKDDSAFDGADAIFCFADGGGRHPFVVGNHLELIGKLMDKGVGLMCAHYGVEVPKDLAGREFQKWIGGHYEHLYSVNPMWSPEFKQFPEHPITRGVKPFSIRDEWYFNMRFDPERKVAPLLVATPSDETRDGPYVFPKGPYPHIQQAKGKPETMMWALERADGGRGVGFTGGHYHRNWGDDNFRKIVLNALLWICKLEVPNQGVASTVSEEQLKENLDPKPPRKK